MTSYSPNRPPRHQHPADLGEQGRLVLDVHADMQQAHRVESARRERQVGAGALLDLHEAAEPAAGGQLAGHLDVLRREVDAGPAADVELIDRGEIVGASAAVPIPAVSRPPWRSSRAPVSRRA